MNIVQIYFCNQNCIRVGNEITIELSMEIKFQNFIHTFSFWLKLFCKAHEIVIESWLTWHLKFDTMNLLLNNNVSIVLTILHSSIPWEYRTCNLIFVWVINVTFKKTLELMRANLISCSFIFESFPPVFFWKMLIRSRIYLFKKILHF